ncbi:MAG: serine hydrolase [Bacteroidetes bacterium]|nr:serine hydrolase [Bacteroidota bacterium]HET6245910.1 serine hydrolase [Bacteroidia bacterium]
MKKKFLIGIGIFVGLLLIGAALGVFYFKPDKEKVLNFIKENPDKANILLIRNDSILAEQNIEKLSPLASTVKIIVAIEYAKQASAGTINPDEFVAIADLEKFHIKGTDGGAHPAWLLTVQNKTFDNKIALREIAKGMIKYSSNANTEWLMERLGLENINSRIDSLGLKNHTQIYYIASAMFIGNEAFPDVTGTELTEKLQNLELIKYIELSKSIHAKLLVDTVYKTKTGEMMEMDVQKIWSNNLPSSTVADYVSIMKKINNRVYFDVKTQQYLDEVMEYVLENPANKEWLEHSGTKGGSTAFALTKALYATDKKGNKTELAYFFNDLSLFENFRLQFSMNEFELHILTKNEFREKVFGTLKHQN